MPRTLVLGGGFGGITVATELRRLLGEAHEVVLVDRGERFSMGLRKLWELVGHASIAEGSRSRDELGAHGVHVLRGETESIDPAARSATVGGETVAGDELVVALGAVSRPDLVDGLSEHGHDVWSAAGVPAAARALASLGRGRIVVLIAGAPYPCPPAPFECALHVDEHLRERGIRDRVEVAVCTVQPMLMPNAGEAGSAWMAGHLEARGIRFQVGRKVERVHAGVVTFGQAPELEYDLLLAVPPHRAPAVVVDSGLTADSGWIAVDRQTLETGHAGVSAVGDVTQILLENGLPLPKAGIVAELEGQHVASSIAARHGAGGEPPPFDGKAWCFIEMGAQVAARFDADFYASPAPEVTMQDPEPVHAVEKRRFESERLSRWFGG